MENERIVSDNPVILSDVGETLEKMNLDMANDFDKSGESSLTHLESLLGAGGELGDIAIEKKDFTGRGNPSDKAREELDLPEIAIRKHPVRGASNSFTDELQELIRENSLVFVHPTDNRVPNLSSGLVESCAAFTKSNISFITSATSSNHPVGTNLASAINLPGTINANAKTGVDHALQSACNVANDRSKLRPVPAAVHDAIPRASSYPPFIDILSPQGRLELEVIPSVSHPAQSALNLEPLDTITLEPSQSVEVAGNNMPEESNDFEDSRAASQSVSLVSAVALIPSSVADLSVDSTSCIARTSETRQKQNRRAAATHRKKKKAEEEALQARVMRLMEENSKLHVRIQQAEEENNSLMEQCIKTVLKDINLIRPEDVLQIMLDLEQYMTPADMEKLMQDINIHLPT